ncbi:MAG: class D sortase, partial [Turicibacter sp.]
ILPIIEGISVGDLERGLGHDPRFVMPGERGNCLIYGHREQFLWKIKEAEIGDSIFIETVEGIFEFQIYETYILAPKDELIFEDSKSPILTVVTCYPFIYFGPTSERFVVKAKLINIM